MPRNGLSVRERSAFVLGGFIAALLGVFIGIDLHFPIAVCEGFLAVGCLALMMPFYAGRTRDRMLLLVAATPITIALARVNVAYFVLCLLLTQALILYRNHESKKRDNATITPVK